MTSESWSPRQRVSPRAATVAPAARWILAALAAGAPFLIGTPVPAVEQPSAKGRPDFAAIDKLLGAGDYTAAARAADQLVQQVKPKLRDDDYLARSIDCITALKRRGFAELRLAQYAAADATFAEAVGLFKDPEFKRLLVLAGRESGGKPKPWMIELELSWIDLFSLRMTALLAALGGEASKLSAGGDVDELRKEAARGIEKYESLATAAAEARKSFADRFNVTTQVPAAPYARSLVGSYWQSLLDAVAALELSRLPPEVLPVKISRRDGSPVGDPEAGDEEGGRSRRLRLQALEHLDRAAKSLRDAIAAATPKSGVLRPDAQIEAAVMEAELLTARARVERASGAWAQARDDADRVVKLHREVAVLRKVPTPDSHPDCFLPLLISADIAIQESRRLLTSRDVEMAQEQADQAQRQLRRARELPLASDHPLRRELTALEGALAEQQASIDGKAPHSEVADAAARRLIRAIKAAPVP